MVRLSTKVLGALLACVPVALAVRWAAQQEEPVPDWQQPRALRFIKDDTLICAIPWDAYVESVLILRPEDSLQVRTATGEVLFDGTRAQFSTTVLDTLVLPGSQPSAQP